MSQYSLEDCIKLAEAYDNCRSILPGNYSCKVRNVELLENEKGSTLRFTIEYVADAKNTKFVFADYPLYGRGLRFCIYSLMQVFTFYNSYIDISYIDYITEDNLLEMSKGLIEKDMFIRVERIGYFNNIRLHI